MFSERQNDINTNKLRKCVRFRGLSVGLNNQGSTKTVPGIQKSRLNSTKKYELDIVVK